MRVLFVAAWLVLAAQSAQAGLEFVIETRSFEFTTPRIERSTILAEGISLKMESKDAQTGAPDTMIYRGDTRQMMVVDHQQRSYMIIDKQFADQMVRQLQQMSGQMKGLLDSVPPEQRALIDQMAKNQPQQNGQLARPQVGVRSTGQQAQVYGYPCQLFVVTSDRRKVRDVWVTNWNNIKGSRNLETTFSSMSDFTSELLSAFPVQAQNQAPMHDNAFATISKMGGFPVASREYRPDGSIESESALRSATYRQISQQEFQQPAGYQQDSPLGGLSSGMGGGTASGGMFGQGRRQ